MTAALPHSLAQRRRRLAAMGIALYRLRTSAPADLVDSQPGGSADAHASMPGEARYALVIVCAQALQDSVRESIVRAVGAEQKSVLWMNMEKDSLSSLPKSAAAYLLLGPDLARTIGAELPTETQRNTPIVVADAPSRWRGDAMAKRLLWQALRPLVRALRAGRA